MINHIWVDADSCPLLVRNHLIKTGARLSIPVTFVANKPLPDFEGEMVITDQTKDSADNYIFEHTTAGTLTSPSPDLVITKDIVFADRLVTKGVHTINDRGTEFTKEIIKELLSERDFNLQLVNLGLSKPHHEGYDKKKFEKFCNCLDRVINRN